MKMLLINNICYFTRCGFVKQPNFQNTRTGKLSHSISMCGFCKPPNFQNSRTNELSLILIRMIVEEIDDSLEFDCSSQESTDSESEEHEFHACVEPERDPQDKEFNIQSGLAKQSNRPPKNRKTKLVQNEDDYTDEGDPTWSCFYCGAIMWYGERINRRRNSLKPTFNLCCMQDGTDAKFGQMYICDTENEAENRANCLSQGKARFQGKKKDKLRTDIIEILMKMLNEVNPYVKNFRSAKERFDTNPADAFHMRIISDSLKDGRTYNTPTASEVAALIPGDFNLDMNKRDIVLQKHSGKLMRINEIHVSYLALQCPLLFAYEEDGFRLGIQKGVTEVTKRHKKTTISMRQFYAFRLQEQKNESHSLLHARRLFQQFLVDAYTTIESNRLRYLKFNQSTLRSDSYDSIKESERAGKTDMHDQGSEFLLPATFTGGPRYMKNNYLDAMTICKHFGFPDLFITFTCNSKWPELTRFLKKRRLKAEDRSEIVCRIFKMKLEALMDDLTKSTSLGTLLHVSLCV
ncbi:unnamed protein product [Brassica napus]|uniref:Helitron helicase-like domain-containing protein n=2 Tax=Brassica TaxID=3705 RepID=A0A3P6E9E8_BRAOL|nr:unnamed protein product [Brassica napus]VDD36268.1 unnamed protein product [Brassica oleracea]